MALEEELKKLNPRERINKLKEIEQEKKKEIAEAEELMRDSERELTDEEETRKKIPIPQVRATDFSTVRGESASAQDIWKTVHSGRESSGIEESAAAAPGRETAESSALERAAQEAPSAKQEEEKGVMYTREESARNQGALYGRQEEEKKKTEKPGYTTAEHEEAAKVKYSSHHERDEDRGRA